MSALLEVPVTHTMPAERKRRYLAPRGILAITMLATGAAGLVYEYVISAVLTNLLGNSIEQFSITIGLMFFAMGLGVWVQGNLKRFLPECFIAGELLLALLGGFSPIIMQFAYAQMTDDFAWIKFFFTGLMGLLIGIEIPLVMRINQRFTTNISSNLSGTWAWDYIGGFVGVLVWLYMLRHFVPLSQISFGVAAVNAFVAVLSLAFFWKWGMFSGKFSRLIMTALTLVVVGLMAFGVTHNGSWSKMLTQKLYDNPIAYSINTKFQNIVMTAGVHPTDPSSRNYELWLNGNKQFSSVDEAIYHEFLVHPAMNLSAQRKRVLILGGGDGLALREVLKYPDVSDVTLVDLDPEMIRLAQTDPTLVELNKGSFLDARVSSNLDNTKLNAGVTDTGQKRPVLLAADESEVRCDETGTCQSTPVTEKVAEVNIFTLDADRFLSEVAGQWDTVIVDLPDPNSVELAKLYSQEFYSKLKSKLSPDGTVVVQSTSPYHAKETYLCILRTMASAGLGTVPYHQNVPSFGDWGWILGSPSLSGSELKSRTESIENIPVETSVINPENIEGSLVFNKGALSSNNAQVSTVMQPVVYSYYTYEGWKVE